MRNQHRRRVVPPWNAPACVVSSLFVVMLARPGPSAACDICAIYNATEVLETRTGWNTGVGQQYSHLTTLKLNDETVDNTTGERLNSSITQLLLGYTVHPRVGVQLSVPIISRTFHRIENDVLVPGDETGIGDLALFTNVRAYSYVNLESVVRLSLLGGLKLPSGNSFPLSEELVEDEVPPPIDPFDPRNRQRADDGGGAHHQEGSIPSAIHGHDIALGSGSVDFLFGGQLFANWRRFFVTTALQYSANTAGSFGYRYANDLVWTGGPGVFLLLGHEDTLGLQAVFSGETKGSDSLNGQPEGGTAITALYAGPGLTFTWGASLSAEIAGDLPVVQNASGFQIVPDYRVRGGVVWRF